MGEETCGYCGAHGGGHGSKCRLRNEFRFEDKDLRILRKYIKKCQDLLHVQQVAFSTYHDCLTQVCFGCRMVRTSMKKEDYQLWDGDKPIEDVKLGRDD